MDHPKELPNPREKLTSENAAVPNWDSKRAILVIHGIGDQNPLETIDLFGRTLAEVLREGASRKVSLSHHWAKKGVSEKVWFDNFLRVEAEGGQGFIDVYEYYWANKAVSVTFGEIQNWVSEVAQGASRFYKENKSLVENVERNGFFTKRGRFKGFKYRFFLAFIVSVIPALSFLGEQILKALALIPLAGPFFRSILTSVFSGQKKFIANLIGEIVAYTGSDRKSKYYTVRQEILNGAVEALRFFLEPDGTGTPSYDQVVLAAHSLGSQVAVDALNRLVHLADEGEVSSILPRRLAGLITFGSPLDKIAFFLREQVPRDQYIRRQFLDNFHSFKQRNWDWDEKAPFVIPSPFSRILDNLPWRNYWDRRDPVGGCLDFYKNLTNLDCRLPKHFYTHNDYWSSKPMFRDIVRHFLG